MTNPTVSPMISLEGPLKKNLSYWRQKLYGIPDRNNIPTDYPYPSHRNGDQCLLDVSSFLKIPSSFQVRKKRYAAISLLQAAFAVFLARYSNENDIVIGCPFTSLFELNPSNRVLNDVIVSRFDLSGRPDFDDFLEQVQITLSEAIASPAPLNSLIQEFCPNQQASHHPLFQIGLVFSDNKSPDFYRNIEGRNFGFLSLNPSDLDLILEVNVKNGGTSFRWLFNSNLFRKDTVDRMSKNMEILLKGALASPEVAVSQLPMLHPGEKQQLARWNQTTNNKDQHRFVHELFEDQARRYPHKTAAILERKNFSDRSLTYRDLNHKANQLARYLIAQGVKKGELVALCMDRSLDMLIGILGIFKAGGVYVPLDPGMPQKRLEFMIENSGVKLLLTETVFLKKLPLTNQKTICPDDPTVRRSLKSFDDANVLLKGTTSDYPAYVIYTSGSTGQPKGVLGSHQSLINRLLWMERTYPLTAKDVCCQKTSLNFVDHLAEIFQPLISGTSLVIISNRHVNDISTLVAILARHRVTRITLVPSLLKAILEYESLHKLTCLDIVICSGEALTFSLAGLCRKRLPGIRLINLYGSTEVGADVTCYEVFGTSRSRVKSDFREELPDEVSQNRWQDGCAYSKKGSVPIGKPLDNTKIFILDEQRAPVPIGVKGEIHVSGSCLAMGYLNNPKLTEQSFLSNVSSPSRQVRMFKTGDLGRWLPDGNLEFLGRLDNQIKLKGVRIELGDIQFALLALEDIKEAVVSVHEFENERKSLVAYLIPSSPATKTFDRLLQSKLVAHLENLLPGYMIPSHFVCLETFPLNTSGKIDVNLLPAPQIIENTEFVQPKTKTEEQLQKLWQQVFDSEPISVETRFIELGGDSLLAMRLAVRINQSFGCHISIKKIFDHSTVRTLGAYLDRKDDDTRLPAVQTAGKLESAPLSFSQKRLWFLNQLEKIGTTYTVALLIDLKGPLNRQALSDSLTCILDRHQSLRTVFRKADKNNTFQVVQSCDHFRVTVDDFRSLPVQHRNMEAESCIKKAVSLPFDLQSDCMLRARLMILKHGHHKLLLTFHHIAVDGWSLKVFANELNALYNASVMRLPLPLSPLKIQFIDFSQWQRSWLRSKAAKQQIEYWQEKLQGLPECHSLPTDFSRPAKQNFSGDSHRMTLSNPLKVFLEDVSKKSNVSLFITLQAVLSVLLARYSNETDIVIGSPVAGRIDPELESMIGFFVNTLVFRNDMSGDITFQQALNRVKTTAFEAYDHQAVPFDVLVEHLNPERSLSRNPLFQIELVYRNGEDILLNLKGLKTNVVNFATNSAKFDITLNVEKTAKNIVLEWHYATDLFKKQTIARMAESFETLLQGAADYPEMSIHKLPLIGVEEQRRLLVDWNLYVETYPREKCLHMLFKEWVDKTPDHTALEHLSAKMTFRELEEQANRVAGFLRSQNVSPNSFVGLYVRRSFEMVIGILGILKSGSAYVPFDPAHPQNRLFELMQDSNIRIVLTTSDYADTFEQTTIKIMNLDQVYDGPLPEQSDNLKPERNGGEFISESLAYMIYTSGSTGKSKGVMVQHKSVVDYLFSARNIYKLDKLDAGIVSTNIGFDATVTSLLLPLFFGKPVVLLQEEEEFPQLWHYLNQTTRRFLFKLTPTHLSTLLMISKDSFSPGKHKIIVGGESLSTSLVRQWIEKFSEPAIINEYGPTEATVACSHFPANQITERDAVPIGKGFPNTRLYVLSNNLELQPIGVPGELFIAGDGVAKGYHDQPELTEKRFLPCPFWPGERMYQTGDIARWLADGNLEFLGRTNFQTKIRGMRIEPGEIEAILMKQALVANVLVVINEDDPDNKRLVAYLTLNDRHDGEVGIDDLLKDHCNLYLPDYMIPSVFVILPQFPITENGKINRKALPPPGNIQISANEQPPQTKTERELSRLWMAALKASRVGRNANFFKSGGHSLSAVQVAFKIETVFQILCPVRRIFEHPTLKELANFIDKESRLNSDTPAKVSNPDHLKDKTGTNAISLSPFQRSLWFVNEYRSQPVYAYNVPLVFKIFGTIDSAALEKAIQELLDRHEILRSYFQLVEGEPQQVIGDQICSFQVKNLNRENWEQTLTKDIQTPFDLSRLPLIRFYAYLINKERFNILLVNQHHIITDGWSLRILAKELSALYSKYLNGKPAQLAKPVAQYRDYINWQLQENQQKRLKSSEVFMINQLRTIQETILPGDGVNLDQTESDGLTVTKILSDELLQKVNACIQHTGVSPFSFYLSIYALTLNRFCRQQNIVIGTTMANRVHDAFNSVLGFFVNMVVLKLCIKPFMLFDQFLKEVYENTLKVLDHQSVPFLELADKLNPVRTEGRNPIFNIVYTFQSSELLPEFSIENTEARLIDIEHESAKFDLTLDVKQLQHSVSLLFEYNPNRYLKKTIILLQKNYSEILNLVLINPEKPISAVMHDLGQTAVPSCYRVSTH